MQISAASSMPQKWACMTWGVGWLHCVQNKNGKTKKFFKGKLWKGVDSQYCTVTAAVIVLLTFFMELYT